MIITIIFTCCV